MIVIKTTKDYIDDLCEMFPTVERKDIELILNYGWRILYLLNSYGGDVLISTKNLWCYFGNLHIDSIKHFKYYIKKLSIKFKILYKRRNVEWDGYYYFALTDSLYEEYTKQINKKGRKKKYFKFDKVFLYKILDDCKILQSGLKYIFRIKYPIESGYYIYKRDVTLESPELIITRPSQKFSDILVSNNNYSLA